MSNNNNNDYNSIPLSFHCTICYHSFDLEKRAPVVLPCGHTFICSQCSQRIDKCMICRTPLFSTPKVGDNTRSYTRSNSDELRYSYSQQEQRIRPNYSRSNSEDIRYSYSSSSHQQGQQQRRQFSPPPIRRENTIAYSSSTPTKKQPLPTPKNLVLMSLIESTQKTITPDKRQNSDDDDDDATSFKDEELRDGVRSFTSNTYGTFVVLEKDGLPLQKNISHNDEENTPPSLLSQNNDDESDEADIEDNSNKHHSIDEGEKITTEDNILPLQQQQQQEHTKSNITNKTTITTTDSEAEIEIMSSASTETTITELPSRLEYGQILQVITFEHGLAQLSRSAGHIHANSSQLVKIGTARDTSCEIEGQLLLLQKKRKEMSLELEELDLKMSKLNKELTTAQAIPFQQHHNTSSPVVETKIFANANNSIVPSSNNTSNNNSPLQSPTSIEGGGSGSSGSLENIASFFSSLQPCLLVTRHSSAPTSNYNYYSSTRVDFRTGMSGHKAMTSSNSSSRPKSYNLYSQIRMRGEHRGIGGTIGTIRPIGSQGM